MCRLKSWIAGALVLTVAACESTTPNPQQANSAYGLVTIRLTDAPPGSVPVESATVWISKVELVACDSGCDSVGGGHFVIADTPGTTCSISRGACPPCSETIRSPWAATIS